MAQYFSSIQYVFCFKKVVLKHTKKWYNKEMLFIVSINSYKIKNYELTNSLLSIKRVIYQHLGLNLNEYYLVNYFK